MSSDYRPLLLLAVALAALVIVPAALLIIGARKLRRAQSRRDAAVGLAAIAASCYPLVLIGGYIAWVGPGRGGVLAQGLAPDGREYCVVQTHKGMLEPYQVSLYMRDSTGTWRYTYLEHEDVAWRAATVTFADGAVTVFRNGRLFRVIQRPEPARDAVVSDGDCPAAFTVDDVMEFHRRRFQ